MNPTVVMTEMGIKAWSDPVKNAPLRSRTPLGKFAGNGFHDVVKRKQTALKRPTKIKSLIQSNHFELNTINWV